VLAAEHLALVHDLAQVNPVVEHLVDGLLTEELALAGSDPSLLDYERQKS
jgi:hypothetical protein